MPGPAGAVPRAEIRPSTSPSGTIGHARIPAFETLEALGRGARPDGAGDLPRPDLRVGLAGPSLPGNPGRVGVRPRTPSVQKPRPPRVASGGFGRAGGFRRVGGWPNFPRAGDGGGDDGLADRSGVRGRGQTQARPRRSKARAKANEPPPKPSVSWVQVEPGKFVRVEGTDTLVVSSPGVAEAEGSRDVATAPPEIAPDGQAAVLVEGTIPDETASEGQDASPTGGAPVGREFIPEFEPGVQDAPSWAGGVEGRSGRWGPSSATEIGREPPAQDEASSESWGDQHPTTADETPPANGAVPSETPSMAEAAEVVEVDVQAEGRQHDEQRADVAAIPELEPFGATEFVDVAAVAASAVEEGASSPTLDRPKPRVSGRVPRASRRAQAARSRRSRRSAKPPRSRTGRGAERPLAVPRAFPPRTTRKGLVWGPQERPVPIQDVRGSFFRT